MYLELFVSISFNSFGNLSIFEHFIPVYKKDVQTKCVTKYMFSRLCRFLILESVWLLSKQRERGSRSLDLF